MWRAYKKWEHTWYQVGSFDCLEEAVDYCATYCPDVQWRVLDRRGFVAGRSEEVPPGGSIVAVHVV